MRIGPLTNIGNDGTYTTIGIDTDAGLPASHTVIVTSSPIPQGTTQVATGQIFVSGTITAATAYR